MNRSKDIFIPLSQIDIIPTNIKVFTTKELLALIDLIKQVYLPNSRVSEYFIKEAGKVAEALSQIDGFLGLYGLGFPFYSYDKKNKKPIFVKEIQLFLDSIAAEIHNDKDHLHNKEIWRCTTCENVFTLPNLKEKCKPCETTRLKPRRILSALPDLDIVVVFKKPTDTTEHLVQDKLKQLGYQQSDISIEKALIQTSEILASIVLDKNIDPTNKIPIDMHIWTEDDLFKAMNRLCDFDTDLIPTRSLHMTWEDNKLGFYFDFLFSLTEVKISSDSLAKKMKKTRKKFVSKYTSDKIIGKLSTKSARAGRLLSETAIKKLLNKKFNSWR